MDICAYLWKASWAEQEQSLKVEMEKLKEKALDLQSQNSALHQELERVSKANSVCIGYEMDCCRFLIIYDPPFRTVDRCRHASLYYMSDV